MAKYYAHKLPVSSLFPLLLRGYNSFAIQFCQVHLFLFCFICFIWGGFVPVIGVFVKFLCHFNSLKF